MDNKNSYTYRKYEDNKLLIQMAGLVGLIVILLLLQLAIHLPNIYLLFFLIIIIILFKTLETVLVSLRRRNYFTWGKGAGAEWVIGNELEKLPFTYELIPDFDSGHGNIDHICIGETGVFVIEVKAMRGVVTNISNQILINRKPAQENYINQTRAELFFLKNLLKEKTGKNYPIIGMLIFPNAKVVIRHPINEIWVGGRGFCDWLIRRKSNTLLSDTEINIAIKALDEFKVVAA